MKKVDKMITKAIEMTDGKCVDVFAYVKNGTDGDVTLGYEIHGGDELFTMCYAWINPEDPGDVPSMDFDNREEALGSRYGEVYKEMIAVAGRELRK